MLGDGLHHWDQRHGRGLHDAPFTTAQHVFISPFEEVHRKRAEKRSERATSPRFSSSREAISRVPPEGYPPSSARDRFRRHGVERDRGPNTRPHTSPMVFGWGQGAHFDGRKANSDIWTVRGSNVPLVHVVAAPQPPKGPSRKGRRRNGEGRQRQMTDVTQRRRKGGHCLANEGKSDSHCRGRVVNKRSFVHPR